MLTAAGMHTSQHATMQYGLQTLVLVKAGQLCTAPMIHTLRDIHHDDPQQCSTCTIIAIDCQNIEQRYVCRK
jgi:hypothetical protein